MKKLLDLVVVSNVPLGQRYSLLTLTHHEALPAMEPGQFVNVQAPAAAPLLRRPISIHDVDTAAGTLSLLVARIGPGTEAIGTVRPGDTLSTLLPLGHGFTATAGDTLLVGGGVGIAPLLYLGRAIRQQGGTPTFLLGGKTAADLVLLDTYRSLGPVHITTEDGTAGEQGFVTNHSVLAHQHFDRVATCGPKPMMQAVARYAASAGTPCEVSLENMMACGLGACLCCVQQTNDAGHVCVCTEGPVFRAERVFA